VSREDLRTVLREPSVPSSIRERDAFNRLNPSGGSRATPPFPRRAEPDVCLQTGVQHRKKAREAPRAGGTDLKAGIGIIVIVKRNLQRGRVGGTARNPI
jgi:hypothetical protein